MSKKKQRKSAETTGPPFVNISGQPTGYTKQMTKAGFAKNDNPPNSHKANRTATLVNASEAYRNSLTDVPWSALSYPTGEQVQQAAEQADGMVTERPDTLRGVVGGNVKGVREVPMGTSASARIENVSAEPSLNTIREPRHYAGAIRERRLIPQGLVFPGDGPQAALEPMPLTDYLLHPEGPPAYGCADNGTCAGHCGGRCSATASFAMRQARRAAAR